MRSFLPLSPTPAERALQQWALVFVGWWAVSTITAGLAAHVFGSDAWSDLLGLRVPLGVVALAIGAYPHLLLARHREAIASVAGLKSQYGSAAFVGVVLGLAGLVGWWWLGAVLAASSLVLGWRVRRVVTIPVEEMTEVIDYANPEHWRPRAGWWGRLEESLGLTILVGLAFTVVLIGGVLLISELLR